MLQRGVKRARLGERVCRLFVTPTGARAWIADRSLLPLEATRRLEGELNAGTEGGTELVRIYGGAGFFRGRVGAGVVPREGVERIIDSTVV